MESAATPPSVLGEFQIVAVLGRGGSGTVYDAIWGPRRVALKVLRDELLGTAKERAQFLAEARRLQAIIHPSVVKVLGVG
ncbi:MAG TPA: protein kinase, partial [Kofleriaceae bacterium]|nr:protein kinase [Kofleriaceae bacterium]